METLREATEAAKNNRMAESECETLKAIAVAPEFAAAYLLRADAQVQSHSFDKAIESVREARRVEPNVMWAGVLLAGAYNGLRRYEDARIVLRGLQGGEAESWQAAYEAARAAAGLNDVDGTLRWSAMALMNAPKDFLDARLVRTNAFLLAHRWSEAQAQMEIYIESRDSKEHLVAVLMALEDVKRLAREQELSKLAPR